MNSDSQEEFLSSEEGEEAAGVCCMRAVKRMKAELEARLTALEKEMTNERRGNRKYSNTLKECIVLRDEQIGALKEQISTKDQLIIDL